MLKLPAVLALCLGLALSACGPPTTTHPVGTTVGLKMDARLDGAWRTVPHPGQMDRAFFHFLPRQSGEHTVVVVPEDGKNSDLLVVTVSTARFGDIGFMNAQLADVGGKALPDGSGGTIPVLYRFDANGLLLLNVADNDAVKAAIRAHQIAGDAGAPDSGDEAVITADPVALDRFFQSPAGRAVFVKPWAVLKKVD